MKRYLLSLLGASALALTVGTARPMSVTFSGQTGRLISSEVFTPDMVNESEAQYIRHINDLSGLSADVQVLNNGDGGVITVYLTWSPRWRSLR